MLHFPSALKSNTPNGVPRRIDSLNATQQKSGSNPIFLKIEEELHDARRVHAHGQEDDLRLALDMVINRVAELSSLLTEAYRNHADLEVQLNVAKSNLALVISNNEMLEDALRRDSSGGSREVGWRRRSGKDSDPAQERRSIDEWQQVVDVPSGNESGLGSTQNSPQIPSAGPPTTTGSTQENGRFFKFRFSSNSSSSRPVSRPSTPSAASASSPIPQQSASPTVPAVPHHITKEIEEMGLELERERLARKAAEQEKTSLEAEIESLSQALFEEANKMVATERIKAAETEEELKELRMEKEALKRALRLIEGENHLLREGQGLSQTSSPNPQDQDIPTRASRSRSSSEVAIKSRPGSPVPEPTLPPPAPLAPEPPSTSPHESEVTPKHPQLQPLPSLAMSTSDPENTSPWADVPSSVPSSSPHPQVESEVTLYATAAMAMR